MPVTTKRTDERARQALCLLRRGYERSQSGQPEDIRGAVADLLADVRHLCDKFSWSYADLDKLAHAHYLAERFDKVRG